MSNKPLHVRCRPKNFDSIIGNDSIVTCLKSMVERKNRPRVYLFHGAYGCGKTTFARILGRAVGCNKENIIEVNAGNEKGIETAREIIKITKHAPLIGLVRFIIIDEAHALTSAFQNALLKTLEETPDGTYFVLCTTEPQKILKTVRDRCVQLAVKPLSEKEVETLITSTMKKEKIILSDKAIKAIVANADGTPRTTLLLIEKLIGLKDSQITSEILSIDNELNHQVIDLCRAIMFEKNWLTARSVLKSILETQVSNLESVRHAILGYVSSVALNSNKPNVKSMLVYECFNKPFYGSSAKADFTFACLSVLIS